ASGALDAGIERRIEVGPVALDELIEQPSLVSMCVQADGGEITGTVRVTAERLGRFVKLSVHVENSSEIPLDCERSIAMLRSLAGTHLLLTVTEGTFISLTDPPDDARDAANTCSNLHTWPVLIGAAGEREAMLSSPIILP